MQKIKKKRIKTNLGLTLKIWRVKYKNFEEKKKKKKVINATPKVYLEHVSTSHVKATDRNGKPP
jgi:hypothetical protein